MCEKEIATKTNPILFTPQNREEETVAVHVCVCGMCVRKLFMAEYVAEDRLKV